MRTQFEQLAIRIELIIEEVRNSAERLTDEDRELIEIYRLQSILIDSEELSDEEGA